MAELPQGTVTFLFTDIEGSTRLLQAVGEKYADVLSEHRVLLRRAFSSSGGVEVDTQGDAFFYAFARAQDAVVGAVEGQKTLSSHDFGDGVELKVRMGIHTGEPVRSSEGYVGPDVHLGSRICSIAWGEQIVVSAATAAVISGFKEVTLRPLGDHALKDIDKPVSLHQVVAPGLREDFPALRSVGAHPTNLPPRLPALIGRERDIAMVTELVTSPEASVVTLVGPGGTGKTRLSLAVAAEMLPSFPDGVFFVDLSALSDSSLVIASIAQALSLRETPGRSLEESLADHLASKETLLVLDNFEQVMEAASSLSSLLQAAKTLKMVVTSREALRISGERVVSVSPLGVPSSRGDLDEVTGSPAVALFVVRAQAVKADFVLGQDNAVDVAAICRRLDGLPLALELAAARINLLSPSSLLSRLDQGLKVLSAGRRDASDRQRTLQGAIAWSYELLSQDEQGLFRRLAVFAGGWTLEAAESVCNRGVLELDVLDGLASLADKSLVRASAVDADRFTMLETIREFVLEKFKESEEAEEIRRAHADYFCALAKEAEQGLKSGDQLSWLRQLEVDQDNLRSALTWSLSHEPRLALEIGGGIWRFWAARSLSEGGEWLRRALEVEQADPRLRARVLLGAGSLAHLQGDLDSASRLNEAGLTLFEQLHDQAGIAGALTDLASIANLRHDLESARAFGERSVTAARKSGDAWVLLRAVNTLGTIAAEEGAVDHASSLYREAVLLSERLGDERGRAMVLLNLGDLALEGGNLSEASEALMESLELSRMLDVQTLEATALLNLGLLALRQRDVAQSMELACEGLAIARSSGSEYLLVSGLDLLAIILIVEGDTYLAARLLGAADRWREDSRTPRSNNEALLVQENTDKGVAVLGKEVWLRASESGRKASIQDVTEEALNSQSKMNPG